MEKGVCDIFWPGWETIGIIGRGRFGDVYEIQREFSGELEKSALKVITIPKDTYDIDEYSDGYDEDSIIDKYKSHLQSVLAEYTLMRKMSNCINIVRCDDVNYERHKDGIRWNIFIKMELLKPLEKSLPSDPSAISDEIVIKMAKDMCNALKTCEKHNVVHRDIKPQNIFVSTDCDYKLGDFGIAKKIEGTTYGTVAGTPPFMAPEVYSNRPYGTTADIYSLGLVLYWVLNNRRLPFLPTDSNKISYSMEEEAKKRRLSGERFPEPAHGGRYLKHIVMKACAYNPKDRYQSAEEMLKDIDNIHIVTTDPPPEDPPPPPPEKLIVLFLNKIKEKAKSLKNDLFKRKDGKNGNKLSKLKIIAIVLAVVLLLYLLFNYSRIILDLFGPKDTGSGDLETSTEQTTEYDESTSNLNEDGLTEPESSTDEPNDIPVEHLYWSEWFDELPEDIDKENYDIEERTLYSSREIKTTSSTETNKLDGWELYDTVEAGAGYGSWSDWTDKPMSETADRQVESQTFYRYRDMETTTSQSSTMSGWTRYDTKYYWSDYGSWSDWTTSAVTDTDSRKVETKTQYRYRDISYSTEYTNWSNWSDWTYYRQSTNDLKKEESRTVWGYYYFKCPNCGAHMHGWNINCPTWAGGCGAYIPESAWNQFFLPVSWESAGFKDWHGTGKYYAIIDGQRYFKWNDANGGTRTQYRYATRETKQVANYGNWSGWGDTVYSNSSTREVQTRTLYRYCTRSQCAIHYFYRWGNWSNWSANSISETSNRQVESKKFYRYRDQVKVKTYYFKKWTEWSEYSTGVVTPSETVQVNTKTQYRFKAKTS